MKSDLWFPALFLTVVGRLAAQDPSATPEPEVRIAMPVHQEQAIPRAMPVGETPPPRAIPVSTPEIPPPRALPIATPATAENTPPRAVPVSTPDSTPEAQASATPYNLPTPVPLQGDTDTSTPPPATGDEEGVIRIAPGSNGAGVMGAAADQLNVANGLYSRKLYDLAAPEYEKFLANYRNDPSRQSALFRLGECYRSIGNQSAAVNSYQNLITEYTSGEFLGAAAYRLAEIYYAQRRYDEAITLYRKAAQNAKNSDLTLSARYFEARGLEETGRRAEARLVFQDIVAVNDKNPYKVAARLALAKYAEDSGNKQEALTQYEQLSKETERNDLRGESLMRAANMAAALGQKPKASDLYQKAIESPGTGNWRPAARMGLMKLRYDSGDFAGAIRMYESGSVNEGGTTPPEILVLAANAYRQANRPADASQIYQQIITGYPDSPEASEARYQRLLNLSNANDPDVINAINEYLSTNPTGERSDKARLLRAEYFYKNKRYAEAAKVYLETGKNLVDDKLKAECLYRAGWCYGQAEDWPNVIDAMGAFIEAFPKHENAPKALVQRGFASLRLRAYTDALRDFQKLIENYPNAPERELALSQKALTEGQQEDNQAMAATFRQLLKEYPQSASAAQAQYYIGWAAFEAKNYEQALGPLDEARKANPKDYFDDASIRIILSNYYLEKLPAVSREVDFYQTKGGKRGLPGEIFRWLGLKYYGQGDMAKAARYLELHIANIPGSPDTEVYYLLGDAEQNQKLWDKARKNLDTYLAAVQEPGLKSRGLLAYARLELGQGNFDAAQAKCGEAMGLQPEGRLNAEARILSGDILVAQGKFADAAKNYSAVTVLYDDAELTPLALKKAAQAYEKAGNKMDAEKARLELKDRYPDYKSPPDKK